MGNNIFNFATKELSQDAMICWCLNWFNHKDENSRLYQMSLDYLHLLMGESYPKEVESVELIRQYQKIDVLVIVNHTLAVVIEDKTYSSEHSNQIAKYKQALLNTESIRDSYYNINLTAPLGEGSITTVYLKTGFWYDDDYMVKCDVAIKCSEILHVLAPYQEEAALLADYIEHLQGVQRWYDDVEALYKIRNWQKCLAESYGQYLLLDELFPRAERKESWSAKDKSLPLVHYIYGGNNRGGAPWTEYRFWGWHYPESKPDKERAQSLFWRVDANNSRYYISLRHYDDFSKKDEGEKNRKQSFYEYFCKLVDDLIAKLPDTRMIAERGYSGGYKESSLITMYFVNDSPEIKDAVFEVVRRITRELEDYLSSAKALAELESLEKLPE